MTDPALTIERVLSDELREWLVSDLRFPVMAVVTPDGTPSQSVMWFMLDPDQPDTILLNTRASRAKYRYLLANPRMSLCFEDELTWVALRGTVEMDEDRERALEDIKTLARRYGDDPEEFNGQERVTLRMRVEKVIRHE